MNEIEELEKILVEKIERQERGEELNKFAGFRELETA